MTKAEFIDAVARQRIGLSKREAGEAVDAVLGRSPTSSRAAARSTSPASGSSTSPSVARARASTRRPASGSIPGGRVPRFTAGSALKKEVKAAAEQRRGSFARPARRRRRRSAQPGRASGSTPTRAALAGPAPPGRGSGRRRRASARPRRSSTHCGALIEAAGPACVAVKPQLACFERLGAPRLACPGRGRRRPRGRAARDRRRQARRRPGYRGGIRARRWWARRQTPVGHGPAASAPTRSRRTRCSAATRSSRSSRPPRAAGAGVFVLVRTSNPGAAAVQDAPGRHAAARARCAGWSTSWAPDSASPGSRDVGAVVGATAPELIGRLRELMPRRHLPAPRASARRAAASRTSGRRSRRGAGGLGAGRRAREASPAAAMTRRRAGGGAAGGGLEPALAAAGDLAPLWVHAARGCRITKPKPARPRARACLALVAVLVLRDRRWWRHRSAAAAAEDNGDRKKADASQEPAEQGRAQGRLRRQARRHPRARSRRRPACVEQPAQLNPDLDPQALVRGPADKLR